MKQRLVGAAVLVSLVVIIAPMVLEQPPESGGEWRESAIPPRPTNVFRTEIVPVREAEVLAMPASSESAATPDPVGGRHHGEAEVNKDTVARGSTKSAPRDAADRPSRRGLGAWAVQLGSFSNSANALALRDRLRAKGYPAFIEGVRVDERDIKRVYVGPELLRAKAAESRKRLEQETELKGLVVRYPAS